MGVDQILYALQFFRSQSGIVGKVEAYTLFIHIRTGLFDMRTEYGAQRGLQQMRAGVVAADRLPAHGVDRSGDRVTDGNRSVADAAEMQIDAV